MGQIATKCPYCGSTNFKQTNKTTTFLLSRGLAKGINSLLGTHGQASSIEEEFEHQYECNSCGRCWVGDGHNPTGMPEDQLILNNLINEIIAGGYDVTDHDEVMRFCYVVDSYLHNAPREEFTNIEDTYEEIQFSSNNIAKMYFLKAFVILQHTMDLYNKFTEHPSNELLLSLIMSVEAGIDECGHSVGCEKSEECYNCAYVLSAIHIHLVSNLTKEQLDELKQRCKIVDNKNYIFSEEYWNGVFSWLNNKLQV